LKKERGKGGGGGRVRCTDWENCKHTHTHTQAIRKKTNIKRERGGAGEYLLTLSSFVCLTEELNPPPTKK
jgi:hypothetical protein